MPDARKSLLRISHRTRPVAVSRIIPDALFLRSFPHTHAKGPYSALWPMQALKWLILIPVFLRVRSGEETAHGKKIDAARIPSIIITTKIRKTKNNG